MRLHGNAALSWQGRRLLARRVLEQGWTLAEPDPRRRASVDRFEWDRHGAQAVQRSRSISDTVQADSSR